MKALLDFMAQSPNGAIALSVIVGMVIVIIAIHVFHYIQEDSMRTDAKKQTLDEFIDKHLHLFHKEELTVFWHHVQKESSISPDGYEEDNY